MNTAHPYHGDGVAAYRRKFGKDRIYDLIRANAALGAKTILNTFMEMLYRFTKGKKFGDDVTLVVIK